MEKERSVFVGARSTGPLETLGEKNASRDCRVWWGYEGGKGPYGFLGGRGGTKQKNADYRLDHRLPLLTALSPKRRGNSKKERPRGAWRRGPNRESGQGKNHRVYGTRQPPKNAKGDALQEPRKRCLQIIQDSAITPRLREIPSGN